MEPRCLSRSRPRLGGESTHAAVIQLDGRVHRESRKMTQVHGAEARTQLLACGVLGWSPNSRATAQTAESALRRLLGVRIQ